VKRRHPVLLSSALALVIASPAAAAEVEIKALDVSSSPRAAGNPGWDKEDVTILPGDTVRWTFAGTQLPHNVASKSPNWNVKTPYDNPGTAVTFDAPGRYDFFCDVHGNSMYGTVVVGEPPPPPLSEQPFPNDGALTGAFETGGVDSTKPRLRGVKAKKSGRRVKVSFRVSEQSVVTVRFARGGKTVKSKKAAVGRRGSVTVAGLKPGRYVVKLMATDVAGNASTARRASFRIG
jgi:plastocyanin